MALFAVPVSVLWLVVLKLQEIGRPQEKEPDVKSQVKNELTEGEKAGFTLFVVVVCIAFVVAGFFSLKESAERWDKYELAQTGLKK